MRSSNTIFIAMLTLSLCATVITTNQQNSVPSSYRMLDVVDTLYELGVSYSRFLSYFFGGMPL